MESSESTATTFPINRAPKHTTLALLCWRARRAELTSCTTAARTPRTLLAAMAIPIPVPQQHIPKSASPRATARPTASP